MQFDSVNQFRSGKDEVEDDAGKGGVPHNLGSFPIRITVIATHKEKLYKNSKPDKIFKVLLCKKLFLMRLLISQNFWLEDSKYYMSV